MVTRGKFPEFGINEPIPVPELDDEDSFTTTSGEPEYDYFANMLFPISVRDTTSDQVLKVRDIRWIDRTVGSSSGLPYYYATFKKKLVLAPIPNTALTIFVRFRKKLSLPVLTADAHIPVIGQEWHEAIVQGATARGKRSLNVPDAERWEQLFKASIMNHAYQTAEEDEDGDYGITVVM